MAIFCLVEGVKGDVTAKGYEGCFELESMSCGLSRICTMDAGSNKNREFNLPQFHELSISKVMDNASHSLFDLALGNVGRKIECFFVKTDENGKVADKYMTYRFEDCLFTSLSVGASKHGTPQENISWGYDKIIIKHTPTDKNNKKLQPALSGYCISEGEKTIG